MLPLQAPTDRKVYTVGYTRGSLPYGVAQHALTAPFSIVLGRSQELERLAAEIELWTEAYIAGRQNSQDKSQKPKIVVLPAPFFDDEEDEEDSSLLLKKSERRVDLLGVLGEIISADGPVIIVADIDGATQPLPHRSALGGMTITKGQKLSLEKLKTLLAADLGYDCEALCESPAQYAVRGGIVDVYPVNAGMPVRIEFFGDVIEDLRPFDPTSQRTEGDKLSSLTLAPAKAEGDWKSGNLASFLPPSVEWILVEPTELELHSPHAFQIPEALKIPQGHFAHFVARPTDHWTGLGSLQSDSAFFDSATSSVSVSIPAKYRPIPTAGLIAEERAAAQKNIFEAFCANLAALSPQVVIFHRGDLAGPIKKTLAPLHPTLIEGAIAEGFILQRPDSSIPLIALAPSDLPPYANVLTITRARRRVANRSVVNELLDFSSVAVGDYLVHLEHGICRYRGITRMDDGQEVLSLEFDESVTLHLRFSEAHLISRYVGLTKTKPRLNKIGSATWAKAKSSAQKATADYAAELLRLQAVRVAEGGYAFPPNAELERQFGTTFPYRLTTDQAKAIDATSADMERAVPMDRLVCGDVGFGKTEVAQRAAFKCAAAGKQVMVLCPTTILSEQHFRTFNERSSPFGVVVECLNRFRSHKEQHAIVKSFVAGRIDILVGTHRLLNPDIQPKDLGLIIIDEEHRFGVDQKELLKRLRTSVDVMAMSATPIPRTLQMALGGARDLSLIETAPLNRRPIETIVKSFDEKLLREAIRYEVDRGGQVFYLHNRVRTIARVAMRLQELFPALRIGIGHGQMPEEELESVMSEFVAGRYDILVCTTIIESGLDIPNSNTLIIEGADQFGLAQLYQIRGRVGRFNRQAYAYLFLHPRKDVSSDARSRLEALRAHNELGAGFKIAMRDLELRGAGNLLGPQQSGHVAGIGFELYCQLLKESVRRLKLGKAALPSRTSVFFDFEFPVEIPPLYIPEARLRLELHRELAVCENLAALEELSASIIDRFGQLPPTVKNLLELNRIRLLAQAKRIAKCSTEGDRLILLLAPVEQQQFIKQGNLFPRINGQTAAQKIYDIAHFLKSLP